MRINISFIIAASVLLTGCTDRYGSLSDSMSEDGLYEIATGTNKFASRVNMDSQWENGDAIGVYMLAAGTSNIVGNASNVKYVTTVDGEAQAVFTPASSPIELHDIAVDFVAYYPYNESVDDFIYNIDLSDQSEGFNKHDLMYSDVNDKTFNDDANLEMTFSHCLSLLKVNVTGLINIDQLTVEGLKTNATFDLRDANLNITETSGTMILEQTGITTSFAGIVLPSENINGMRVVIQSAGEKYTYTVPEGSSVNRFEKSHVYNFNINVDSPDKNSLESVSDDNSSVPWDGDKVQEGTCEPVIDGIPEDYSQIMVNSVSGDLLSVLQGYNGNVAVIFESGEYNITGITIPEGITGLMLYAQEGKDVKLNLATSGVKCNDYKLNELSFHNVEITSSGSAALVESFIFANNASVEIINSRIQGVNNILSIDATPGNSKISVKVDNCIIGKLSNNGSFLRNYAVSTIDLSNSTLYGMNVVANSGNMGIIKVENCTLVDFSATLFENSGLLYFNKNVLSSFTTRGEKYDNLCYKLTGVTEFSGNYYETGDSGKLPMIQDHNNDVDPERFPNAWIGKSATELFDGKEADKESGLFYTTLTNAGDPRWRVSSSN